MFLSRTRSMLAAGLLTCLAWVAPVEAGPIPYPNPGVENPLEYTFTAATTGVITAYFYGSGAGYTNELTMLVNGVATGIQGLNNHTSQIADSLVMGNVNAGDVLTFVMVNLSPGNVGPWYSNKAMNVDGTQHIYSTDFASNGFIPDGTYVAFEDLDARNGTDFNYFDETFVFTNVNTSVPEPATFALLAIAGVAAGAARRRRQH